MKTHLHTQICGALALALMPQAWAQEPAAVPMEAKAAVIILSQPIEEPSVRVQPRLRDSLQSIDHAGADEAQAYPYRLSADERRRLREQLRGQAPVQRGFAQ